MSFHVFCYKFLLYFAWKLQQVVYECCFQQIDMSFTAAWLKIHIVCLNFIHANEKIFLRCEWKILNYFEFYVFIMWKFKQIFMKTNLRNIYMNSKFARWKFGQCIEISFMQLKEIISAVNENTYTNLNFTLPLHEGSSKYVWTQICRTLIWILTFKNGS